MHTELPPLRPLGPLPAQPAGVEWPTTSWPTGPLPPGVDLDALLEAAFDPADPMAHTYAVVVVAGGRVVAERYGGALPNFSGPAIAVTAEVPLLGWSMAKSVLHAAVGLLVAEGRLALDQPAPVPGWSAPGDPRGAITVGQLLAMRDGLDFAEEYTDEAVSDTLEMLYGSGHTDMAAFAAAKPLAAQPGTRFSYSSGTSNILAGIVAREVGPGEPMRRFLAERIFEPLGMASAEPTFDQAGTWVASSFLHATARDWARFGLLYLRGGLWEDRPLLASDWVDGARVARSVDPEDGDLHSRHWWVLDDRWGSFRAGGFHGQMVVCCPGLDLVLVRLGDTPTERKPALVAWRDQVLEAFGAVQPPS